MKWFRVVMVVYFHVVFGFGGEDYLLTNNLDTDNTDTFVGHGSDTEDHPFTLNNNATEILTEQGVVPLIKPKQIDSGESLGESATVLPSVWSISHDSAETGTSATPGGDHQHHTTTSFDDEKAGVTDNIVPVNGDSNDISKNSLIDAEGGWQGTPSSGAPPRHHQQLLGGGSAALDQMCLGRVVDKAYRPLDEWYDDSCHKYRCEIVDKSYHIKIYSCEQPQKPENAIECRQYQLNDGNNVKYPGCCPRLRCIVSYHDNKFIQIVGQKDESIPQDMTTREAETRMVEAETSTTSLSTRELDVDESTTEMNQLQIIKRAEEEFVRTLGFGGAVAPSRDGDEDYEHAPAPRRQQHDDDYDSKRLMSQVSDQMCIGVERRRRKRYTPLRVWYDDACHKYRCEVLNGKYHIAVIGCIKPEAPINAIQCNEYNLDNENVMYPVCCPRLRCVVVIKGEMYVRISGQPEEEFPDVPLRTNQPGSVLNLTRNIYAPPDTHTNAPVTYYYPKQEVYNDPMETAARARPEPPIPMLNVHMDWKHNILTEYIHRGVIKALQYLKESLK